MLSHKNITGIIKPIALALTKGSRGLAVTSDKIVDYEFLVDFESAVVIQNYHDQTYPRRH